MSMYEGFIYAQQITCPAGAVPYTIQAGDTIYRIAGRLGTTVAAILALNPGINPNALQIGQQICVPGAAPPPTCTGTTYTIRPGDTFYAIAARYGISLQALIAANPDVDPNRLVVGQTICIPTVTPPAPVTTPCSALLQPVTASLPPAAQIPTGAAVVRQVAMSTREYTVVASALPEPGTLGNFNGYVAVLSLLAETGQRMTVNIRLGSSQFGTQTVAWAGSTITAPPPVPGDTVEVRPANIATGRQGPALLRADLGTCRT